VARGQFGRVAISMEPNKGNGYESSTRISVGRSRRGYRRRSDKGVQEARTRGVLAGYPMS